MEKLERGEVLRKEGRYREWGEKRKREDVHRIKEKKRKNQKQKTKTNKTQTEYTKCTEKKKERRKNKENKDTTRTAKSRHNKEKKIRKRVWGDRVMPVDDLRGLITLRHIQTRLELMVVSLVTFTVITTSTSSRQK